MRGDRAGSGAGRPAPGRARPRLLRAVDGTFGYLLAALVALMMGVPLLIEGWVWKRVLALSAAAVLVTGLYAARPGRRSLAVGLTLAALDVGCGRFVAGGGPWWVLVLQVVLWLATLGYVTVMIFEAIFDGERVTVETLQAAFCVYLLLGLVWAYAFALIELMAPGSFPTRDGSRVDWSDERSRRLGAVRLFVLSFSTLAGTGYGDVAPAGGFAGMAANLEAMTAQVYLAVVIARLVAIQATPPPDPDPDPRLSKT